ncbi:hypothetical protein JCM5296_005987 [Sporobolomyces johnsonii]
MAPSIRTVSIRSSRFAKADPVTGDSPLLKLSPELIDHTLSFLLPPGPRSQRAILSKLLLVHPSITPIVRRRLYRKLSLIVGHPKDLDKRLIGLLDGVGAGQHIRYLRLRYPDPDWNRLTMQLERGGGLGEGPAGAILPTPRLSKKETVAIVAHAFEAIKRPRHVEVNLQVATRLEGAAPEDDGELGGPEQLEALENAMKGWRGSLETFVFAFADVQQRLQILSDVDPTSSLPYRSPFLRGLQSWDTLTTLDLWRVRLVLPFPDGNESGLSPPSFRLQTLHLKEVEFGSSLELLWLLGDPTSPRSGNLSRLVVNDVSFLTTPNSSAPLLAIFLPEPSFAQSLTFLNLELDHLIGDPTPEGLLRPFVNLKTLELGGPGVDLPLLSSIFPPSTSATSLKTALDNGSTTYPSQSLAFLALTYLPHPSLLSSLPASSLGSTALPDCLPLHSFLPTLLKLFNTPLSRSRSISIPRLRQLVFRTQWRHPRHWSWTQLQHAFLPSWRFTSGIEEEDDAWAALESGLRRISRARRKEALQSGEVETGPISLKRNGFGRDYADDASEGEGGSGEDDEEDTDFDPHALFVPSSGDEGPVENNLIGLGTRDADADADTDDDSDF